GRKGGHGKTTAIDFSVKQGRIQDVLRMFVKAKRPPLEGVTDFHAHVTVPPGDEPFLKKLALTGDFGVENGQFTTPETQGNVAKLSETGAGKKPQPDTGKNASGQPAGNAAGANQAQGNEAGASGKEVDPSAYDVVSELAGHVDLRGGTATFKEFSFNVPD